MSETVHTRIQKLFSHSIVEGLSSTDQAWLDAHLQECAECAREAATTRELLTALHTVPVAVPSDLAVRAQLRVRLRVQQSSETSSSSALLWIITAASWLLGIFSAPLVWRGFAWVGERTNLPKPVLELGFVLWWAVPALIAVAVVLHQRAASSRA
jgi:anti-sigma factor RsiW